MKKITCNSCKKYWIIDDNDIRFQKNCPFCNRLTIKSVDFNSESVKTFQEAVALTMVVLGQDVLLHPSRLSGYISDMTPNYMKELRIFKRALAPEYSTYIKAMYGKESKELMLLISKYRKLLVDYEGLSDYWIDLICNTFQYVFGNNILLLQELNGVLVEDIDNKSFLCNNGLNNSKDTNKNDSSGHNANSCRKQKSESNIHITTNNSLLYQQAERCMKIGDYGQATELYRKFANSGDINAMNQIAIIYYHKGNYKKAWKWFLKAADLGNSESQYYVGVFNEKPIYVQRNLTVAIKYYKRSANKGYKKAEEALIDMAKKMSYHDKQRYNMEKYMKNEWIE